MFGYHISYHLSKHLPLTIGYGSITDFNQFSELDIDVKSPVTARELDFKYELFENKKYKIDLIAELDGIFLKMRLNISGWILMKTIKMLWAQVKVEKGLGAQC